MEQCCWSPWSSEWVFMVPNASPSAHPGNQGWHHCAARVRGFTVSLCLMWPPTAAAFSLLCPFCCLLPGPGTLESAFVIGS